jgi:hypothetical protein
LNHFTVPCAMYKLLAGAEPRTLRGPADLTVTQDATSL